MLPSSVFLVYLTSLCLAGQLVQCFHSFQSWHRGWHFHIGQRGEESPSFILLAHNKFCVMDTFDWMRVCILYCMGAYIVRAMRMSRWQMTCSGQRNKAEQQTKSLVSQFLPYRTRQVGHADKRHIDISGDTRAAAVHAMSYSGCCLERGLCQARSDVLSK